MDELARRRDVRGPHRITNYARARFPEFPSGVAVAKWMYGDSIPPPENLQMFAEAFGLSEREKIQLALAHTYHEKSL
jgi:hypothetical protein